MPATSASSRSPRMTVNIAGSDYYQVQDYSWSSDALCLGDSFACTLNNDEGLNTAARAGAGQIVPGAALLVDLEDPDVEGGKKIRKMTGIVTKVELLTDMQGGEVILVSGADLGWHLTHNDGAVFLNLQGITFAALLDKAIDPSWGFKTPGRVENDTNRNLKLGRAGVTQSIAQATNPKAILPRIQIEPGEKLADVLITYAKRVKKLVNVSSDGYLQIWQPNYSQKTMAKLEYHAFSEKERRRNNVKAPIRISYDLDGLYTKVVCVGTVTRPAKDQDSTNPNAGKFRGEFLAPQALPFVRLATFADPEQLKKSMADDRAKWKWQRGQFDSFKAEYTVDGHSQGGFFFESDTMIAVDDSVHQLQGNYYCSAVRYNRKASSGTTTTLTLRKPNLLAA